MGIGNIAICRPVGGLSVMLLIILFEHKSGIDITDKSMLPFTVDMVFMWDNKYGPNKRGRVIW